LRLAAIYAGLFGASALALVLFLWWETATLLDRQVEAAIIADARGLAEQFNDGGLPALTSTIRDRLVLNVDDDAIYLLVDDYGTRLAGNLERWPPGVVYPEMWYELAVERGGVRAAARVRRFDLPGGVHLLVGRDVRTRLALRNLLTDALFWAVLVLFLLAGAGALLMNRLFRSMLANVSATSAAIAAGDLSRRVQHSGRGDEFDNLAETINDMLDRIARLMDGVRQVSNAIAHDLRTPIARARARLEYASEHAQTEADLHAAVDRALADLDGVVQIFQALLRIAEIEAGARRSAFADVDLSPVLADLAELYGALAEDIGLTLELSLPPALRVHGDRDLLQQAVANLLDNAVKFSPHGGKVRLEAMVVVGEVRVLVSDQGSGIPIADRQRAVQRFFRGEQARHTPGSGLGLALVSAVAQLHGGALTLEDNSPGLRAVLTLPVRAESAAVGRTVAEA
jgi:signal transduction histidine kinase